MSELGLDHDVEKETSDEKDLGSCKSQQTGGMLFKPKAPLHAGHAIPLVDGAGTTPIPIK